MRAHDHRNHAEGRLILTRIEVRNFQSLKKVDLDLGRLTVIVGPSSSGKSAVMRAFKAVASNIRGSSVITRGQKACAITVKTADMSVTLERSETTGAYRVVDPDGQEHVFTKLAGGVPEHVTAALRIDPVPAGGTSVNFAGQFDKPYLLDDTGANVARSLGELTNVTTIFEAVRAANKNRLSASSTLKTRKSDIAGLKTKAQQFHNLQERLRLLDTAEQTAAHITDLESRITRLRQCLDKLTLAEDVLNRSSVIPEVPDPSDVERAQQRLRQLVGILQQINRHTTDRTTAAHEVQQYSDQEHALQDDLKTVLYDAGTCPTCGQRTQ